MQYDLDGINSHIKNLNQCGFDIAANEDEDCRPQNHSVKTNQVEVYFKNIKDVLCDKIKQAELIVGCVAWLTDTDILKALAKTRASIIVQKEDFLRPDSHNDGKNHLRTLYDAIESNCERFLFQDTILPKMSYCGDPCLGGIRCVGNHNSDKNPAHPRMHNKFIVFCKIAKHKIEPQSVWTGSFNFTNNAGSSLENAVLLKNKKIAMAYLKEFGQIAALSEPLDWQSKWMAPEWRLGS